MKKSMSAICVVALACAFLEAAPGQSAPPTPAGILTFPAPGAARLRGRAGAATDACIASRTASEWARGPMYREAEDAFKSPS